jgi:hypothetical protein
MTDLSAEALSPELLEALRDDVEVEIETWSAERGARRVIIWSVVVDGVAYIRSYRGVNGRWYQDVLAEPRCVIHARGHIVKVRALAAIEPETIQAVSDELAAKYADDSAMPDMLAPSVLGTTLRLEPD